ncbi:Uncharacterised protein [Mycobacterium tuberculosis]|nr:Uncharacterised protein [Mycobacterium tuberculosis]
MLLNSLAKRTENYSLFFQLFPKGSFNRYGIKYRINSYNTRKNLLLIQWNT